MGILTHKQIEKGERDLNPSPVSLPEIEPEKIVIKEKVDKFWVLLHPENGVDDYVSFQDVIEIEGVRYERKCVQGIITTNKEPLKEFLLNKGYKMMEEIDGRSYRDRNKRFSRRIRSY